MMKTGFVLAAVFCAALGSPALAQQHVSDLMRESSANGIAFATKYAGKPISIDDYVIATHAAPTGTVGSISIGAKPDKFGFPPSRDAMCVLNGAQDIQTFGSVPTRAHIVLTGTFSEVQGSTIVLKDCSYRMSTAK